MWRSTTWREADARLARLIVKTHPHHMAVRRRTCVIRVLPNEANFLWLASALASGRNEQWMVRRYVTTRKISNEHSCTSSRNFPSHPQ